MKQIISSRIYYDITSKTYQTTSNERANYLDAIDQIVRKYLAKLEDLKLLEIGAGNGVRTKAVSNGITYKKLLLIEEPAVFAKELLTKFDKTEVHNGAVENYEHSKGTFNFAFSLWNVVSHVTEPQKYFNSINNLLEDDGLFIFDLNNRLNVKEHGLYNVAKNWLRGLYSNEALKFNLNKDGVSTGVYIYKLHEIKKLLHNSGFTIEKKFTSITRPVKLKINNCMDKFC